MAGLCASRRVLSRCERAAFRTAQMSQQHALHVATDGNRVVRYSEPGQISIEPLRKSMLESLRERASVTRKPVP